MKQTSSKKRTNKDSHKKIGRQSGSCECNSASEMCGKVGTNSCASTRASRSCSGSGVKSSARKDTFDIIICFLMKCKNKNYLSLQIILPLVRS